MTATPPDLSSLRIQRDEDAPAGARRGRVIAIVIVVLLVLGAGAWWFLGPRNVITVRSASVTASGGGSASSAGITANGYVVAFTHASVSAKILGRLATLDVHEGSHVKKGDVIASLDDADYRAQVATARAAAAQVEVQLAQAKRDLSRAQQLREAQLNTQVDIENAETLVKAYEAQLATTRAQTELAEATLENARVRAPFDGTVLRKDAEVGEIVAPSSAGGGLTRTAIVTMADLSRLEVEVDVNEAYIAQIHNAQKAQVTLDAYPDTSFGGQVRQVVPTADRQKATVQVKVSILDRDPRILPEMGAKVLFVNETRGTMRVAPRRVMVAANAVVQGAGGAHVWVIENGRVTSRAIEVGDTRDDQVEVRSGLGGGESIVVQPPAGLKDGARVRVGGS
jgi:RND family efflux transporter MFP subunit